MSGEEDIVHLENSIDRSSWNWGYPSILHLAVQLVVAITDGPGDKESSGEQVNSPAEKGNRWFFEFELRETPSGERDRQAPRLLITIFVHFHARFTA